jgi:hypothetical protein
VPSAFATDRFEIWQADLPTENGAAAWAHAERTLEEDEAVHDVVAPRWPFVNKSLP